MNHNIRAKRIIGGKTYNTETATKIASQSDLEEQFGYNYNGPDTGSVLFQTRHGAYFLWHYDDQSPEYEKIEPLTPDEAQNWMEKYCSADLIEEHFGEMPEAGDAESRFTLRMPDSLKQRIDTAAKLQQQSTNAFIVRCLEKCLEAQ